MSGDDEKSASELLFKVAKEKRGEMREAAKRLDFELAAILRDELKILIGKNKKHE